MSRAANITWVARARVAPKTRHPEKSQKNPTSFLERERVDRERKRRRERKREERERERERGSGAKAPIMEKKRKKKGRPSLIDLQKRSLRLQQLQQPKRNPNPSPNPQQPSHRRITRQNPNPEPEDTGGDEEEEEEEEDGGSGGKRREKKLKLVLKLPKNASDSGCSGSDGEDEPARRKRRIEAVGDGNANAKISGEKGTDRIGAGEPPHSGPTTPLPDKKLLLFILDRLQKKDTYGVYSEPVDPEELPDYHEVIAHPMDFGTVRKKLTNGVYVNLEQFEKDVFLISSNSMKYNAPSTIYHRQARAIQELAKKSFENLRQESDDNEPEQKTVRRGRPPTKHVIKRMISRPPENAGSDPSTVATLANAGDNGHWSSSVQGLSRKAPMLDKPNPADVYARELHGFRKAETSTLIGEHKPERDEELTGSMLKGVSGKYGKKPIVIDENRRNTYKQSQWSTLAYDLPLLTDGEKKQLIPIGFHMEHTYPRSLARFAAKLGPIAWAIASRKIERALPPGSKFGRGWVGDGESPQQSKLISCSTSAGGTKPLEEQEPPSSDSDIEEGHSKSSLTTAPTASESRFDTQDICGDKTPSTRPRPNPAMQPGVNGVVSTPSSFNLSKAVSINSELPMTHARALDMVSRGSNNIQFRHQTPNNHSDAVKTTSVSNQGSPPSGVIVESHQPDLALQL
ncbi:Bromodomain-containing protein [Dioscorea alata]|uniref:Bromodomain-containing protein n=1 Tax=Dioscorea alata TaxID=55571 RepID=A0ACB7V7U6_DIOAL|nr:Bromodomain-containing protein [Dioscorea alata]